jgi:hypothetical protein
MSITIAGEPILVDVNGGAQAWLDSYLPTDKIFGRKFSPNDTYLSGPRGTGEFFASSLPDLPEIKIGQIQWPCVGVSRFARALILVDRATLFEVLNSAWDVSLPATFPYPIPTSWAQTANRTVAIRLNPDLAVHMFVLLPIRVSDDLWILPLVDGRYYGLGQPEPIDAINAEKPSTTWASFFSAFSAYNYSIAYTAEAGISYGNPDPIFRRPQVALPYAIDAACFSVGCRPVVPFPVTADQTQAASVMSVKCERPSTADGKKITLLAKDKITGGVSGQAMKPYGVSLATRLVNSYYSGENRSYLYFQGIGSGSGEGVQLFAKCLWNVHLPSVDPYTEFQLYASAIADKLDYWNNDEYYVTLPDLVAIDPSGFDDYIVYDTLRKTTTVRSLPVDFMPPYLLSQSPSGSAYDSAEYPVKWFHTQNQIVSAKVSADILGQMNIGGVRQGVYGVAQIIDGALVNGSGYFPNTVNVLNGQRQNFKTGDLIYMKWFDDVAGGTAREGWVICDAPCVERLGKFTMLTDWYVGKAHAHFQLIDETAPYGVGIIEDPLGVFADVIVTGNSGLSRQTCSGRYFAIQAPCNQQRNQQPNCCRTWKTRFLHVDNILVSEGQEISFNQQIATLSDVGDPGDPHLHYEVLLNGISIKIDDLPPHVYPLCPVPGAGTRAVGTVDDGPPSPACAINWIRKNIPVRPVLGTVCQTYGSPFHTGDAYWAIDIFESTYPTKSHSPVRNFALAFRTIVETVDSYLGLVVLRHECASLEIAE